MRICQLKSLFFSVPSVTCPAQAGQLPGSVSGRDVRGLQAHTREGGGGLKASARTGLASVRHGTGRAAAAARMRGVRAAARER